MRAVRDHPGRPGPVLCRVLDCLALRLDWQTGYGFASIDTLIADTGTSEATVRRALRWARSAGLVDQYRRGHRIAADRVIASEWRLLLPVTGDRLAADPTGHRNRPNRSERTTQPVTSDTPSRPSPSRPSPSARTRGPSAAEIIRAVYPDATDDEIKIITEDKNHRGARSAEAVLAHEARQGTLRLPCNPSGPGRHSGACRDGRGGCAYGWCACRCHAEPGVIR
jgi:hypothetical protein